MTLGAIFRPCLRSFVILGLAVGAVGARAAEPARVVLQLPYTHQFQFAGVYAAIEQGYFQDEGLEVEVRQITMLKRSPLDEVLEGKVEFGIDQATRLISRRLQGADLTVLAAILQHSPQILLTKVASNLATPHDLAGRRVAFTNISEQVEIRLMLENEGVDFDQITVVENRWDRNELLDGTADAMTAFVLDLPLAMRRAGTPVQVMRPADYGVDFYGDCLFTSGRYASAAPAVVDRMRRALLRGWTYAMQHPDELIDLILRKYPPGELIIGMARPDRVSLKYESEQMAQLMHADHVELGLINSGRWRRMAEGINRHVGEGDLTRLAGMIQAAPVSPQERLRESTSWLLGGLAVALIIAVGGVFANRRLQLLVQRRTRELAMSEQRQREYFELAPAPILIEDYSAFAAVFAEFRAAGVTDLRQHLQAQPALLRALLPQKRIVAANRLALSRMGFDSVAGFDRGQAEIMTPDAYDSFAAQLAALWDGVDRLSLDHSYRTKNNELVHILVRWEVGRKEGGRDLANVRLVFTEVTALKRAEQARAESEARYGLLFQQSPVAILEFEYGGLLIWLDELRTQGVTDFTTHALALPGIKAEIMRRVPLTDVNTAALTLFGVNSAEEFLREMPALMTADTVRVRLENMQMLWEGHSYAEGLVTIRRKDGEERTCSYFWKMPASRTATQCRAQTMLIDISERLQAEQALRQSEERYRELFEQAVGGIYRTSPEGRFLSVNPALAKIHGFEHPEEMIIWSESNATSALYVQSGRRDDFISTLNARGQLNDFESEVRHRTGGTVWISENARAVRDEAGRLLYYEGFVTDISARRQLEAEIGRASKLEAVGILAGGIAHDFNNILTVVLGNVTLAETDTPAGSPVGARLQDAKRATLRARDLTLQLLTFAKGGEPVRTIIGLPELLREAAGFALHGSKARGDFHFDSGLWTVNADKGQVGQVIQNLVINAVQAMPDGGAVTIAAANRDFSRPATGLPQLPPGRYVEISVADTGLGIAREHLGKIFDPYFTTKEQGTGLGLASVYSIVRKHEGRIVVESEPGQGTVFRFWLPAASDHTRGSAPSASGSRSPFRARTLFMDDEPSIRTMAILFMERLGYDCEVAADGAEAVRKYQEAMASGRKYQVVVMDLTVPGGMGGREAMEELRRMDPAVYAIVSSGYSRDPVLANFQAHGFRAVLPKPYGLEQLTKVMRAAMEDSDNSR